MNAVQAMTGHGGWPMSVFLTPSLEPFYGGTYFPPTDSRGMPGFPRVLLSVHRAWEERRDEILGAATEMTERLRAMGEIAAGSDRPLDLGQLDPRVQPHYVERVRLRLYLYQLPERLPEPGESER